MKNILNRVLALAVALLVLCAPIGAMAEEMPSALNATLALSNLRLTMGEEVNAQVDVTAQLDLSADLNAGAFAGTLTALSGANKALKGGFSFDASTMELVAGLEGVTDAVVLPMGEIIEQVQAQLNGAMGDEGMGKLQNLFTALMNLTTAAENSGEALGEIVMNWVSEQIISGYKGETSLEVDGITITADQYDFEITLQELVTLAADLVKAVQADPELTAAVQAYVDAVIDLTGEETAVDIASLDIDALLAQMPEDEVMTIAGSLFVNGEEGHVVLDTTVTVTENGESNTIPYQLIVLNKGETVYVGVYMEMDDEYQGHMTVSVDVNAAADDTPVFDVTVNETIAGDGNEQTITMVFTVDCSDGANITVYAENSNAFTYNEQSYNSLMAFGLNYTGTMTSDEKGIACPGTLTLYVNNEGQEITVAADTLVSLNANSTVDFNMPANRINLSEADEDTMNALSEEYMNALSSGLMALMGAPGMQDLMGITGLMG